MLLTVQTETVLIKISSKNKSLTSRTLRRKSGELAHFTRFRAKTRFERKGLIARSGKGHFSAAENLQKSTVPLQQCRLKGKSYTRAVSIDAWDENFFRGAECRSFLCGSEQRETTAATETVLSTKLIQSRSRCGRRSPATCAANEASDLQNSALRTTWKPYKSLKTKYIAAFDLSNN